MTDETSADVVNLQSKEEVDWLKARRDESDDTSEEETNDDKNTDETSG